MGKGLRWSRMSHVSMKNMAKGSTLRNEFTCPGKTLDVCIHSTVPLLLYILLIYYAFISVVCQVGLPLLFQTFSTSLKKPGISTLTQSLVSYFSFRLRVFKEINTKMFWYVHEEVFFFKCCPHSSLLPCSSFYFALSLFFRVYCEYVLFSYPLPLCQVLSNTYTKSYLELT